MKKYKKLILACCMLLVILSSSIGGFILWCSYHPEISVHVDDGGIGREIIGLKHLIFLMGKGMVLQLRQPLN